MQQPVHDDALGLDAVEGGVRKLRNDGPPHVTVDPCEYFGMAFDSVESRAGSAEKSFTEALGLLFVVRNGASKVSSDPATEDQRQGH
jgi:hypothetical protein